MRKQFKCETISCKYLSQMGKTVLLNAIEQI